MLWAVAAGGALANKTHLVALTIQGVDGLEWLVQPLFGPARHWAIPSGPVLMDQPIERPPTG